MNREDWQAAEAWYLRILILALIATAGAALMGCGGGGDDEEDGKAGNQPVNCQVNPEKCK